MTLRRIFDLPDWSLCKLVSGLMAMRGLDIVSVPQAVREIAWKAQSRLNQRYRALLKRGKLKNVAITAVAREFVGFIWAVAQAVRATAAATNTKAPAVTS